MKWFKKIKTLDEQLIDYLYDEYKNYLDDDIIEKIEHLKIYISCENNFVINILFYPSENIENLEGKQFYYGNSIKIMEEYSFDDVVECYVEKYNFKPGKISDILKSKSIIAKKRTDLIDRILNEKERLECLLN